MVECFVERCYVHTIQGQYSHGIGGWITELVPDWIVFGCRNKFAKEHAIKKFMKEDHSRASERDYNGDWRGMDIKIIEDENLSESILNSEIEFLSDEIRRLRDRKKYLNELLKNKTQKKDTKKGLGCFTIVNGKKVLKALPGINCPL